MPRRSEPSFVVRNFEKCLCGKHSAEYVIGRYEIAIGRFKQSDRDVLISKGLLDSPLGISTKPAQSLRFVRGSHAFELAVRLQAAI